MDQTRSSRWQADFITVALVVIFILFAVAAFVLTQQHPEKDYTLPVWLSGVLISVLPVLLAYRALPGGSTVSPQQVADIGAAVALNHVDTSARLDRLMPAAPAPGPEIIQKRQDGSLVVTQAITPVDVTAEASGQTVAQMLRDAAPLVQAAPAPDEVLGDDEVAQLAADMGGAHNVPATPATLLPRFEGDSVPSLAASHGIPTAAELAAGVLPPDMPNLAPSDRPAG